MINDLDADRIPIPGTQYLCNYDVIRMYTGHDVTLQS